MALPRTTLCLLLLGILICPSGWELRGEESAGAQVLFSFDRNESEAAERSTPSDGPVLQPPVTQLPIVPLEQSSAKIDPTVALASLEESTSPGPVTTDRRRLAPPSRDALLSHTTSDNIRSKLPFDIPHVESLGTAGAGLVLVVGLFLLCVSLMRRGGPSPTTPLPQDAVAVLGRVPLTPKQFAHLIQVGNKLVLVSINGDRTDTITEITDPAEVERLLVMCLKGSRQSSSADFQKLLAQMAKEPARGFLGRDSSVSTQPARG
jgi:flagellar biogenesis protein FliO